MELSIQNIKDVIQKEIDNTEEQKVLSSAQKLRLSMLRDFFEEAQKMDDNYILTKKDLENPMPFVALYLRLKDY